MLYKKNTIDLTFKGSNIFHLISFYKFIIFILYKQNIFNLKIKVFTLPKIRKKYTLLKSPHVHKTARTQLEVQQNKTIVTITNFTQKSNQECWHIIKLLIKRIPTGITVFIKKTSLQFI